MRKKPKFELTRQADKRIQRNARRQKRVERWRDKKDLHDSNMNILNIVLFILLAVSIIGVLNNTEILTFEGMLKLLQNAPSIDTSWLDWSEIKIGDWGIFQPLGNFINSLIGIVNALAFCGNAIVNCLLFIFYFLYAIFL